MGGDSDWTLDGVYPVGGSGDGSRVSGGGNYCGLRDYVDHRAGRTHGTKTGNPSSATIRTDTGTTLDPIRPPPISHKSKYLLD